MAANPAVPDVTRAMRRDWDDRARTNAFHYIASWRKEWDLDSFLKSGEEDFQKLVAPAIAEFVRTAGGEICELSGEDTPLAWCCGAKLSGKA
jgi:hypothetical protein